MISCTINGKAITVEENTSILEAAKQNGSIIHRKAPNA